MELMWRWDSQVGAGSGRIVENEQFPARTERSGIFSHYLSGALDNKISVWLFKKNFFLLQSGAIQVGKLQLHGGQNGEVTTFILG